MEDINNKMDEWEKGMEPIARADNLCGRANESVSLAKKGDQYQLLFAWKNVTTPTVNVSVDYRGDNLEEAFKKLMERW